MSSIFFCEVHLIRFTFNLRFLCKLKHKVRLSKTVCGIFHFWFRFVFIKVYIFVQNNAWTLWFWNDITPFKFKIIGKPENVLLPNFWFQVATRSFQIQWYRRELELPKTDLVTDFLNPENRSFEKVSIVAFK